jgi:hypothetical protein
MGNCSDRFDFVFQHLHGTQNRGKLAALIRCLEVVLLSLVLVVAPGDWDEP